MKRTSRLVIAATALTLLAACGGGGSASEGSDGAIKVGAWVALSGPVATVGVTANAGTKAAFGEVNAAGGIDGKDVKYQALDDAYDPQQTTQVARKLVQQDKVVAIVGALGTASTEAAFPFVLKQSKVPIVGPYAGNGSWFASTGLNQGLWGMFPLNDDTAAAAADWALDDGAKKVAIVRSEPESFAIAGEAASNVVEAGGGTTVDIVSKLGTTDFAPIISKVAKAKPDAVVMLLTTSELAIYLKEAKQQGVSVPTYGYTSTVSNSLIDLIGEDAEDYRGISAVKPPTSDDAPVKAYRDALAKYAPKEEPDFVSLSTYAYAKAFSEVLKSIKGEITPDSINKAFATIGTIDTGVMPPLEFSADQNLGVTKAIRVKVTNGAWEAVGDYVDLPKH